MSLFVHRLGAIEASDGAPCRREWAGTSKRFWSNPITGPGGAGSAAADFTGWSEISAVIHEQNRMPQLL